MDKEHMYITLEILEDAVSHGLTSAEIPNEEFQREYEQYCYSIGREDLIV